MVTPYPNHLLIQRNLFDAVDDPPVRLFHFGLGLVDDIAVQDEVMVLRKRFEKILQNPGLKVLRSNMQVAYNDRVHFPPGQKAIIDKEVLIMI